MSARLFVGNLNRRTSKRELAHFFARAGKVVLVSLPVDRASGEPRGFGFVEFDEPEGAERALTICDGLELNGARVRLSWARERDDRNRDRGAPREQAARRGGSLERSDDRGEEGAGSESEDYSGKRVFRSRKHGKHGWDRRRGQGTRRIID